MYSLCYFVSFYKWQILFNFAAKRYDRHDYLCYDYVVYAVNYTIFAANGGRTGPGSLQGREHFTS